MIIVAEPLMGEQGANNSEVGEVVSDLTGFKKESIPVRCSNKSG